MQGKVNEKFISDYSKQFTSRVVASSFEDKAVINGKEILSLTPSKQVNFFIIKALYSQWQEEMRKLESPYFNHRDPGVKKALANYMNVLSQHIEVKQEDMANLVELAIIETLYWLISPYASLEKELSEKGITHVDHPNLKAMTRYFKVYGPAFQEVLAQNEGEEIAVFLEAWGTRMEDTPQQEIINTELELLSEVVEISTSDILHLEDEAPPHEIEDDPSSDQLDLEEELEPVEEEKHEENASYPEEEDNETGPDLQTEEEGLMDDASHDPEKVPIDEEVSSEQPTPEENENEPIEGIINEKFRKKEEILNDQFRQEEVSVAATHQQRRVESILEAISLNNQYMFTSELFGDDNKVFLEAIGKIEGGTSFDAAVEMLVGDYASKYSWDMNSNEVKELLKVVFRKFR